jgi:hypothetical protein
MNADTREVVLATIRGRLLDDDAEVLRLDPDDADRHTWSIVEHALDAALARGASLQEVHATAAVEVNAIDVEGMESPDVPPDGAGLFREELDTLADEPLDNLGFNRPDESARTLNELRREQTARVLYMLVSKLAARAQLRVRDAYFARLDAIAPEDAPLGSLIDRRERLALFHAGLYGDPEESPAA